MNTTGIQQAIDSELDHIRAHEDDPMPSKRPHGIRPNRATVLSVRLSADEFTKLATLAEKERMPVSTLARKVITDNIDDASTSLESAVERALRRTFPPDMLIAPATNEKLPTTTS